MMTKMHGRVGIARQRASTLILLSSVLAVCQVFGSGCSKEVSDRDIKTIALADAARLHARSQSDPLEALFIDPRSKAMYDAAHIAGARHLQLTADDTDRGTDPAINRYGTLIVYGNDPGSAIARAMAKRMMAIGYSKKKVKLLADGLVAWDRAGLPVERAP
ncbi:MAG: rhodanese-like domain-containing protein [Phycisphaerales bacterium]